MNNIEVVGLGALNIDHIYEVDRILTDGEAVANSAASFPGGSAANTVYGLAKLGVKAGFIGAVGDDAEGRILLNDFQKIGVNTGQIKVEPGAKTGSVLCLSDRQGQRSLYVTPGANSHLTMDDVNLEYINQAKILHISSFVDESQYQVLLELMDRLEPSIRVSFSPGALYASKGLKALSPILARTYVLFANRDEIMQLTGQGIIAAAETCRKNGCQTIVVTLGGGMMLELSEGTRTNAIAYVADAENEYAIEPTDTSGEVDTTGAGDAFAAGFLYGFLNGKELEECGRISNIVAQFSISETGARRGLPTLEALSQRYQQLYDEPL